MVEAWLIDDLERILGRLRRERRALAAGARYAETLRRVDVCLRLRPAASANEIHEAIGGRRQDVLRAVRETRSRFPTAGNHEPEAGLMNT